MNWLRCGERLHLKGEVDWILVVCSKHKRDQGVSKWVVLGATPGLYQWPKTDCPSAGIALKAAWEMTPIRWGCAVPQTGISIFVDPYYSNVDSEKH